MKKFSRLTAMGWVAFCLGQSVLVEAKPAPVDEQLEQTLANILGLRGPSTVDGLDWLVGMFSHTTGTVVHSHRILGNHPNQPGTAIVNRDFFQDALRRLEGNPEFARRVAEGARHRRMLEARPHSRELDSILSRIQTNPFSGLLRAWERDFRRRPVRAERISPERATQLARSEMATVYGPLSDRDFESFPYRYELQRRAHRLELTVEEASPRRREPHRPSHAEIRSWAERERTLLRDQFAGALREGMRSGYIRIADNNNRARTLSPSEIELVLAQSPLVLDGGATTSVGTWLPIPSELARELGTYTTLNIEFASYQGYRPRDVSLEFLRGEESDFENILFQRNWHAFTERLSSALTALRPEHAAELHLRLREGSRLAAFSWASPPGRSDAVYESLTNYLFWAESRESGHWRSARESAVRDHLPVVSRDYLMPEVKAAHHQFYGTTPAGRRPRTDFSRHAGDNQTFEKVQSSRSNEHYSVSRRRGSDFSSLFFRDAILSDSEVRFSERVRLLPNPVQPADIRVATLESVATVDQWVPLLIPDNHELWTLHLRDQNGVPLGAGDYRVYRDPETAQLAVRVIREGVTACNVEAGYITRPAAVDSIPVWQRLEFGRLRPIVERLESDGFVLLARAFRHRMEVRASTGYLTVRDLAATFSEASHYSYRSVEDIGRDRGAARAGEPEGPFADFVRFLNREGRMCSQCSPEAGMFNAILNEYYRGSVDVRMDTGYLLGPGGSVLTAGSLHARSLVVPPADQRVNGAAPLAVDATARTPDPDDLARLLDTGDSESRGTTPSWLRAEGVDSAMASLDHARTRAEQINRLHAERARLITALEESLASLDNRVPRSSHYRRGRNVDPGEPLLRTRRLNQYLQDILRGSSSPLQVLDELRPGHPPVVGDEALQRVILAVEEEIHLQRTRIGRFQDSGDSMSRSRRAEIYQDFEVSEELERLLRQAGSVLERISPDLLAASHLVPVPEVPVIAAGSSSGATSSTPCEPRSLGSVLRQLTQRFSGRR